MCSVSVCTYLYSTLHYTFHSVKESRTNQEEKGALEDSWFFSSLSGRPVSQRAGHPHQPQGCLSPLHSAMGQRTRGEMATGFITSSSNSHSVNQQVLCVELHKHVAYTATYIHLCKHYIQIHTYTRMENTEPHTKCSIQ